MKGVHDNIHSMGLLEAHNEKTCKGRSILWLQMVNEHLPVDIIMIIIYTLILQLKNYSVSTYCTKNQR